MKADVAALKADAEALRATLPDSVRGLASLDDVSDGVTGADKAALEAVLDAESNYENGKSGLQNVYAEVGRIGFTPVESAQFGGFMLSIVIGVTGIVLSLPLGILLALGRQSDLLIVKSICVGFIEFIRGVPLITLLFVASTLLNYFLPPGTTFDIILRVMIMVTLLSAAYMAEVVRGGLAALPTGQYEAADALGLDYWKSMRLIIMPQALKISIPSIVGIFIGLFKDTVLVSIIGLMDPLGLSNAIRADANWNGIVWELYGFIALMFFIVCFSMGRYAMYLERKLQTGH
jgi:His/Glu/Gln/Arg/opine family amino acid ABC transporter permease subunit